MRRGYPYAPLAAAARRVSQRRDEIGDEQVARFPELSDGDIASVLGVTRRTIVRWKIIGLDCWTADKAAVRLGLHPCEVWGDAWWDPVAVTFDVLHEQLRRSLRPCDPEQAFLRRSTRTDKETAA